jgi:PTH1 family peptidyl-tRNA hydrolase
MAEIKMVVGLGNPGAEYTGTRHNTGFRVIDALAERLQVELAKRKFGARFGLGEVAGRTLMLLKPWQFMNRSGMAVAAAAGFYKIEIGDLMVVTDDMALEPGRIRIRAKGSAGGHNGLADVIEKLGTDEFARCRVGIGQSGNRWAVDYVLDEPTEAEQALITEAIARVRDAVLCWIEYGVERAMNEYNKA